MSGEMEKKASTRQSQKRSGDEEQLTEVAATTPLAKKKKPDDEPPAPDAVRAWRKSTLKEVSIQSLESRKLLQEQSVIRWHAATGDEFPSENCDSEIVIFFLFIERGLVLPPSDFLHDVLNFYGIELVHLNPNGILHISFFVHLSEAYLGISPNFALFRCLFRVKLQLTQKGPLLVGSAGIQLYQKVGYQYLYYILKSTNNDWRNQWFYICNHAPNLPKRSGRRPEYKDCWVSDLEPETFNEIPSLLKDIQELKKDGLMGHSVVLDWLKRRFQQLQRRVTMGYEYLGER